MTLQVLISTMHREDHSLLKEMNIQTDAIVVNQCDRNETEEFLYRGKNIKWYSSKDRGVGLSRNTALMHATADILLFADDDVIYEDGYAERVISAFKKYPRASLIVFNLHSLNPERPEAIIYQDYRLRWYNCLRYGGFRIAVRREAILQKNIFFSLLFGGGAIYQAGEDNLFITQCIQSGLVCMASAEKIGVVEQEESTWFRGYTEKYYKDRGALFSAMYGRFALGALLLMEVRRYKETSVTKKIMRIRKGLQGVKEWNDSYPNK